MHYQNRINKHEYYLLIIVVLRHIAEVCTCFISMLIHEFINNQANILI
jgi:hypothetical protein